MYDCYCMLYEQDNKDIFWVTIIKRTVFITAVASTLTNHYCAFTLAVCDIILNSQSKNIIYSKSRIKHRMVRYLVSIWNISIVTTKCNINLYYTRMTLITAVLIKSWPIQSLIMSLLQAHMKLNNQRRPIPTLNLTSIQLPCSEVIL